MLLLLTSALMALSPGCSTTVPNITTYDACITMAIVAPAHQLEF